MRIRSIKPEFWRSDDTASLKDWHHRLVFIGLWQYVDDNGVGRDNAALIMSDLFPQEPTPETLARIERALDELSNRKMIVRYTVENRDYLFITNWHHQKIDRPSKSQYPEPVISEDGTFVEGSRDTIEPSLRARKDQGIKGSRDQGIREATLATPSPSRGTRLTEDLEISEAMRIWATDKVPGLDINRSTEKFNNHFRAKTGKGSTSLDWVRNWRNWMLGDFERMPANTTAKPSTTDARVSQSLAAVESLRRRGIDTGSAQRQIEAS